MNKNRHRIVFNAARGQHMAVCETASSLGSPSSPPTPALAFAALLLMLLAPAQAQVVADPSAPGNQRPTILQTANGLPQINIQTPSAAGVSRNTYRQFDVQSNGVILNNSRTNVQTQIGGFVSGNPWISTPARVILNEVNSSNPSYLKGPVEVAGQRAEVIIANPSGIRVNGGSFINASSVTLATGTPVMNSGNLESFRVAQGAFVVEGLGLDTRTADYTTILARAMEVNAGLWAKHLKVVTGANQISADGSIITATPASAQGTAPRFMLDVAAIGGMYAGHIYLVGTEAGLGVNNGGVLSADAGDLVLDSNGWLRNKGTVQASGNVAIATQGEVKNDKDLYAGGTLNVTTSQALTNSGSIGAQGGMQIQATATENLAGARIASNATVQVRTSGVQTNKGEIVSAGDLTLQAAQLQNESRVLSIAGNVNITSLGEVDNAGATAQIYAAGTQHIDAAGALTNSGLIAALGNLTVEANSVHSTGALAAGLNTDGSLKADAALLDVRATQQLTAQGHNLASGHFKLEGQALDIAGSQTQAKTLALDATGRGTGAAPGTGLIDASNADMLAHGWIDIDGKTLKTTGAQLQALGDIEMHVEQLNNQAGLIRYRVALHTASGALGGGWSGAAGAAVSGASADLLQAMQDNLQQGLEAAGLGEGAAKGVAQGVATLTAAGMGAAVGGAYGAASAATVDANNRQLHPTERKKAEELSKKSGGRYTQQQIEDAMRNSGNSAIGENITAGMVLDPNNPNPVYDSGAVFQNTGSGVVQELPNNGYVDPELAAFIQTNTGSGSSPYAWSDAQQGKALPMPTNPNAHLNTMTPNVKGYVTPEAAAGLSPVREAIRDENDIRTDVADLAAGTSRVAGVVAASSTTAASVPGPHQPGAAATALTATGVGFAAGAIEQLARPDVGKGLNDFMSTILQEQIDRKLPIAAPLTNETLEYWKKSGSSLGFENWMSNQWNEFLKSKESK